MQLGLFGVAFGFVHLKRTGALRRLFATPTSPAYFLGGAGRVAADHRVVQVAILFGIGIWFGLQMFGDYADPGRRSCCSRRSSSWRSASPIAGWAKNEDQAAPVANLISLPMMFLSGRLLPARRDAGLPGQHHPVHAAHLRQRGAARGGQRGGRHRRRSGPQLLGMGVWAVITFVLAVRLFQWE